jgi:hypothetical protein
VNDDPGNQAGEATPAPQVPAPQAPAPQGAPAETATAVPTDFGQQIAQKGGLPPDLEKRIIEK